MTQFRVTAEHTAGATVGHNCRCGSVDDPADLLDLVVEAKDEDEAISAGQVELFSIIADYNHCPCGKTLGRMGSNQWWESVSIIAEKSD